MSWLFSQALVAEFSAATSWDGAPSAPLSVMPTQHKFWHNDKPMEPSRLSRFGLTCAVLTAGDGEALLMRYLADFPARTSQQQAREQVSRASAPANGDRWHESSVKYDRNSRTWKTHRCLFEEDLPWSSVTLPRWGMTLDGVLWEPPISGRPINGTASGSWPTPTASLGTKGGRVTPRKSREGGTLIEAVSAQRWPTPKANDSQKRGNFDAANPRNGLPAAVKKFPTPLASDWKRNGSPRDLARRSPALGAVVQLWPTPVADDTGHRKTCYAQGGRALSMEAGGTLNPTWVEWLMGWPLGWSDLKPLEMDRFQQWRRQHSLSSPANGCSGGAA